METEFKTKKELMLAHTELSADLAKLNCLATYSDCYDGKTDAIAYCISVLAGLAVDMDKQLYWPEKGQFTRGDVSQLEATLRSLKGALEALHYMLDPIGEPCETFCFMDEFSDILDEAEQLAKKLLAVYDTYPAIDNLNGMPDGFEGAE